MFPWVGLDSVWRPKLMKVLYTPSILKRILAQALCLQTLWPQDDMFIKELLQSINRSQHSLSSISVASGIELAGPTLQIKKVLQSIYNLAKKATCRPKFFNCLGSCFEMEFPAISGKIVAGWAPSGVCVCCTMTPSISQIGVDTNTPLKLQNLRKSVSASMFAWDRVLARLRRTK